MKESISELRFYYPIQDLLEEIMLTEQQRAAYQSLYHTTGIPFLIVSVDGHSVTAFPDKVKNFYQAEYWSNLSNDFSASSHPDGVTLVCVGEASFVAIVKLNAEQFFCTVPIRSVSGRLRDFFTVMQEGIQPMLMAEFCRFLAELPVCSTIQMSELASLAKVIFCGQTADGTSVVYLSPLHEVRLQHIASDHKLAQDEIGTAPHLSIDSETGIANAIEQGDEVALSIAISRPMYGMIGRMSLNDLRQARYEFICMMYMCCRAAIKGGINSEYGFELSDLFCQRMDGMTKAMEIRLYCQECMRTFCRKVAQNNGSQNYSRYTVACRDYIRQHLFEPIDIETISRNIGLNRRSLARYFISDIGTTIHDYIIEKRVEEGAYLLTSSNLSIGEISELLQFSSQSKFTEKFRIKYSVTPMQYRKQRQ